MDAIDLLPTLPDKSVDLVLTDPPYDLPLDFRKWCHQHFIRVSRTGIIIFCPPENQWMLPANQYLFWVKPISTKNTSRSYSRFVEMILVYGTPKWDTGRHWSQYTNVFVDLVDDATIHPHRKPPSLITRLLLNHSNKGDTILDPFAGSRVVELMCNQLGRHCISSDINHD